MEERLNYSYSSAGINKTANDIDGAYVNLLSAIVLTMFEDYKHAYLNVKAGYGDKRVKSMTYDTNEQEYKLRWRSSKQEVRYLETIIRTDDLFTMLPMSPEEVIQTWRTICDKEAAKLPRT